MTEFVRLVPFKSPVGPLTLLLPSSFPSQDAGTSGWSRWAQHPAPPDLSSSSSRRVAQSADDNDLSAAEVNRLRSRLRAMKDMVARNEAMLHRMTAGRRLQQQQQQQQQQPQEEGGGEGGMRLLTGKVSEGRRRRTRRTRTRTPSPPALPSSLFTRRSSSERDERRRTSRRPRSRSPSPEIGGRGGGSSSRGELGSGSRSRSPPSSGKDRRTATAATRRSSRSPTDRGGRRASPGGGGRGRAGHGAPHKRIRYDVRDVPKEAKEASGSNFFFPPQEPRWLGRG